MSSPTSFACAHRVMHDGVARLNCECHSPLKYYGKGAFTRAPRGCSSAG